MSQTLYTDIQMLDWYKSDESELVNSFIPDVLIAADIIYDSTLFEPLSRTIERFFDKSKNCKLYMACTVRNENTIDEFLNILGGTIILLLQICCFSFVPRTRFCN